MRNRQIPSTIRRYDETFIKEAIALYERSNTTFDVVAKKLGIHPSNLTRWYNLEMLKTGKKRPAKPLRAVPVTEAVSEAETTEEKIARLERQLAASEKKIAELETDRAILKKAAAFFAKESE